MQRIEIYEGETINKTIIIDGSTDFRTATITCSIKQNTINAVSDLLLSGADITGHQNGSITISKASTALSVGLYYFLITITISGVVSYYPADTYGLLIVRRKI
jgi:hypothetical protein